VSPDTVAALHPAERPTADTPIATIDAVILNYRTPELTAVACERLRASRLPDAQLRVWIVDNGSNAEEHAALRRRLPDELIVHSPRNVGFAGGNNLAVRRILADAPDGDGRDRHFVLLLNSDTEVEPDAVGRLVRFLDEHPDVGVVGPRLLLPDGSLDLACRRGFPTPVRSFWKLTGLAKLFPQHPRFAGYNLTYLDELATTEVDAVVGACMLVRLSAIDRAGLLDEAFFMYGEDLDWCYRIKARGWRVFYEPSAVVHHFKGASTRRRPYRMIFEFYRAMWLFHAKHYAQHSPFLLNWLVLTGIIARGAVAVAVNAIRPAERLRAG
jgi:GT2 family glycosyltransferase